MERKNLENEGRGFKEQFILYRSIIWKSLYLKKIELTYLMKQLKKVARNN